MAHSHHMHREHQVSHRRVHKILEHEPAGAKEHNNSHAFSKVTSKTAAVHHDGKVAGHKSPKRFARGGKVHPDVAEDKKLFHKMMAEHEHREAKMEQKSAGKYARGGKTKGKHGHQTNIAIVVPGGKGAHPGMAPGGPPMAGAGPMAPPPGGPPMPPPGAGAPPGLPPGMPPGGPPMRARGGKICKAGGGSVDGESSKGNIKSWGKEAKAHSYARGGMTAGAMTGVGRLEKAHHRVKK